MYQVGSLYKDMLPKGALASNKLIGQITSDTTTVGATIDRQGYGRVLFQVGTGTVTDGDYAFSLYAGDESDMSDEALVTAADLNGSFPSYTADTDDDKIATVEYVGNKRYLRVKIVSTNTSSGAYVHASCLLAQPLHPPVQT